MAGILSQRKSTGETNVIYIISTHLQLFLMSPIIPFVFCLAHAKVFGVKRSIVCHAVHLICEDKNGDC